MQIIRWFPIKIHIVPVVSNYFEFGRSMVWILHKNISQVSNIITVKAKEDSRVAFCDSFLSGTAL